MQIIKEEKKLTKKNEREDFFSLKEGVSIIKNRSQLWIVSAKNVGK